MNQRDKDKELLRDLHALARLQPDAEATARAIERARAAVAANISQPSSKERNVRRNIMSLRNLGAVAAVLLAIALLSHWWAPSKETGGFAFGQVQEQVEQTKTVQYVQTHRSRTKQNKAGPVETRKVMILGSHRMREEVKTTAGDPLPKGEVWTTGLADYIMVQNMATGKMIDLYPSEKGYSIPQEILGIDPDTNELKRQKIVPIPKVDFYNQIRGFPADKAKRLPDRTIGGRVATGFQLVETAAGPRGRRTSTRTYWVDRETKLPVRIEASHRSTDPMMVDSDWVYSDFVFDAPLDEALFSTDPPAGYKDLAPKEQQKGEIEKPKQEADGGKAK
jgi:hypothetical protein